MESIMGEQMKMVGRKVMVAIDDNECSTHALDWALESLRDCLAESLPLLVYTVQPISALSHVPPAAFGPARVFTAMSASPELMQSLQEYQNRLSLELLERAKRRCAEYGIKAETISEVGEPKEAICTAVEKFKIDLLILGSHGRGALHRAFLGSVSNYCTHHAKCPVLIVKQSA